MKMLIYLFQAGHANPTPYSIPTLIGKTLPTQIRIAANIEFKPWGEEFTTEHPKPIHYQEVSFTKVRYPTTRRLPGMSNLRAHEVPKPLFVQDELLDFSLSRYQTRYQTQRTPN